MEVASENFESFSYRELQALAKARNVKANGKKEQLIRRLTESAAAAAAAAQKENVLPKTESARCSKQLQEQQQPCDKENVAVASARKTMATPLKKALGQISINTPRGASAPAAASHKKLFSNVNKANILQSPPAAKLTPVQLTGSVPTEPAVAESDVAVVASEPPAVAESEAAVAEPEPAAVAESEAATADSEPAVDESAVPEHADSPQSSAPDDDGEPEKDNTSPVPPATLEVLVEQSGATTTEETGTGAYLPSPGLVVREPEQEIPVPQVVASSAAAASPSAISAKQAGEEEEEEEEEAQNFSEVAQAVAAPSAVAADEDREEEAAAEEEQGGESEAEEEAQQVPQVSQSLPPPLALQGRQQKEDVVVASVGHESVAAAKEEGDSSPLTQATKTLTPEEVPGGLVPEAGPAAAEDVANTTAAVVSEKPQQEQQQHEASKEVDDEIQEQGPGENEEEDEDATVLSSQQPALAQDQHCQAVVAPQSVDGHATPDGGTTVTRIITSPHPKEEEQQQNEMNASALEERTGSDAARKNDVGIVPEQLATAESSIEEKGTDNDAVGKTEIGVVSEEVATVQEDALGNMPCADPPASETATVTEKSQVDVVAGDVGVGNDVSRAEQPAVVVETATAAVQQKPVESVVVVVAAPAATLPEVGHVDVSHVSPALQEGASELADRAGALVSGEGRGVENTESTSLPPPSQSEVGLEVEVVAASMAKDGEPNATLTANEEGAVVRASVAKEIDPTATFTGDEGAMESKAKEVDPNAKLAANEEEAVAVSTVEEVEPSAATLTTSGAVSVVKSATTPAAAAPLPPPQASIDEETRSLVAGSQYLKFTDGGRRVMCTLTGKKIAPDYMSILLYIGSRKVQQLLVEGPFVMSEFEGMFMVEDPADEHFVFCELTGVRMFKSRAAVNQHINSQLFSEAMASIMADIGSS